MSLVPYHDRAAHIMPSNLNGQEGTAFRNVRLQKQGKPWHCGKLKRSVKNSECKSRPEQPCMECSIPNILP